jgi:hypothetical protein
MAESVVWVVVKQAQIVAQRLSVQPPPFNVGGVEGVPRRRQVVLAVLEILAELWPIAILFEHVTGLQMMPRVAFVQCQGHHLVRWPGFFLIKHNNHQTYLVQ